MASQWVSPSIALLSLVLLVYITIMGFQKYFYFPIGKLAMLTLIVLNSACLSLGAIFTRKAAAKDTVDPVISDSLVNFSRMVILFFGDKTEKSVRLREPYL